MVQAAAPRWAGSVLLAGGTGLDVALLGRFRRGPATGPLENREAALAALEPGGIGAASVLTAVSTAYLVLTHERRELMREWVVPLHEAIAGLLGLAEQTGPRRYLREPASGRCSSGAVGRWRAVIHRSPVRGIGLLASAAGPWPPVKTFARAAVRMMR